jgi:hypothetical protein
MLFYLEGISRKLGCAPTTCRDCLVSSALAAKRAASVPDRPGAEFSAAAEFGALFSLVFFERSAEHSQPLSDNCPGSTAYRYEPWFAYASPAPATANRPPRTIALR